MCCLEKKKGDRKKGERRGEGEGWAVLCLKTRRKGGGEREEQTGRREGSGVEVRGGWMAGAVAGLCLWRGAELDLKSSCSSNNMRDLC